MRLLIILQLALGTYVPRSANAAVKLDGPMTNQLISEIALNNMFERISTVKTGADLGKLLTDLNARDQRWAKDATKKLKKPIRFERLNRGVAAHYDGQRYEIAITDTFPSRMRIDGKADFRYQPANSLEVQLEALSRALDRKEALLSIGMPEAHAVLQIIIGGIIGGIVAASLAKLIEQIGVLSSEKYCPGRTKADSYWTSVQCEKYFAWAEANNKTSDRVPNKDETKPSTTAGTSIAPATVYSDCPNSKFVSVIEGEGKTEMETVYKDKKADKITVAQTVKLPSGKEQTARFEIALDDSNQLKSFKEITTGEILATNEAAVTAKMTPTQLAKNQQQVDKGSKLVSTMIGFLDFCRKKGEETIAKNAVQPPNAVAGIGSPTVIAPVVPTVAPTTAPTSTQ